MPKLTPIDLVEEAYILIDTMPGITIREVAERLGINRDRAKYLVTVTLERHGYLLVEVEPRQEFVRCGNPPRGFAAF